MWMLELLRVSVVGVAGSGPGRCIKNLANWVSLNKKCLPVAVKGLWCSCAGLWDS